MRKVELRGLDKVDWAFTSPSLPTAWCGCRNCWPGRRCMKRKFTLAKAFKSRWCIVEMDNWPDQEYLDLVEPAHITFEGDSEGKNRLRRPQGLAGCSVWQPRWSRLCEFSWERHGETDPVCGCGWVALGTAGHLVGHIFIHNGDDSGFACEAD